MQRPTAQQRLRLTAQEQPPLAVLPARAAPCARQVAQSVQGWESSEQVLALRRPVAPVRALAAPCATSRLRVALQAQAAERWEQPQPMAAAPMSARWASAPLRLVVRALESSPPQEERSAVLPTRGLEPEQAGALQAVCR
jgi:hypothetical protein